MRSDTSIESRRYAHLWIAGCALACSSFSWAQLPLDLVERLEKYPHAVSVSQFEGEVQDHEIGLGAIRKVSGAWRFKSSERLSGVLKRNTWQIVDGFTSVEVLAELEAALDQAGDSELLFACEGRSCGQGVQWANRVFGERVLYGREEMQRYRVYDLKETDTYRVLLYSSARTADRQYMHMESLRISAPPDN